MGRVECKLSVIGFPELSLREKFRFGTRDNCPFWEEIKISLEGIIATYPGVQNLGLHIIISD